MLQRVRRAVLVLAVAAGVMVVPSAAWAGPAPSAAAPLEYVNMGDSYSAGAGIVPLAVQREPRCLQAVLNWARDISRARQYDLTDVSCSGADTTDFTTMQYPTTPPQLDALSASTDLVTLTIGGNDGSVFTDAIQDCATAASTTAGKGNPCEKQYGNTFVNKIDSQTAPKLQKTLAAIRSKAPNARVAISGYLQILPPTQGCYPVMPVAVGDVPYLNRIEKTLNDVVAKAARQNGVTYLDVTALSAGHDACQPVGTRWVEPIGGSTNFVPVHPNALGERAMADNAIARLGL